MGGPAGRLAGPDVSCGSEQAQEESKPMETEENSQLALHIWCIVTFGCIWTSFFASLNIVKSDAQDDGKPKESYDSFSFLQGMLRN